MLYVMRMSTDRDILETGLDLRWEPVMGDYRWEQIVAGGLNIPAGSDIIVIAHGNETSIGNQKPGAVDIDAAYFIALLQRNLQAGGCPQNIYISTCSKVVPAFAARAFLMQESRNLWPNIVFHGHCEPIAGKVPSPKDMRWYAIMKRTRH